jgi:GNAT superfamily N-acetyltransferase
MRVWPAAPEEAPRVAELLAGFRDHMGRDTPVEAAILATVRTLMARDDVDYLLGAAGDGSPAEGVAQVRYRLGVWWNAEDCWLEDLFVAPSARGSGLGRALVQGVLDRAAARGCRRVELDVNDANLPALRLYESLGFATGRGGAGRDLLMRRPL